MTDTLAAAQGLGGSIQNTAADQAISGAGQGAELAMALEKHQNNMEAFQQQQAQFKEQQNGWAMQQLGSTLSITNPQLRAAKFAEFQKVAGHVGINVDPAWSALVKDDDFARKAQQGLIANANLRTDNGNNPSQMLDVASLLGDAAQGEKAVHLGAIQGQVTQNSLAAYKYGNELNFDKQKAVNESAGQLITDNKDRLERIGYANQLLNIATDRSQWKDPVANASMKSALLKTLFPGGVIKESEVNYFNHLNPGWGNKIEGFVKGQLGMGDLPNGLIMSMAKRVQSMGNDEIGQLRQQIAARAPNLSKIGIDPNLIAKAVIPQFNNTNLDEAFTPPDPMRQMLVQHAATNGVKIDPNNKEQVASYLRELSVKKGAGATTAQAVPQPQPGPSGQGE